MTIVRSTDFEDMARRKAVRDRRSAKRPDVAPEDAKDANATDTASQRPTGTSQGPSQEDAPKIGKVRPSVRPDPTPPAPPERTGPADDKTSAETPDAPDEDRIPFLDEDGHAVFGSGKDTSGAPSGDAAPDGDKPDGPGDPGKSEEPNDPGKPDGPERPGPDGQGGSEPDEHDASGQPGVVTVPAPEPPEGATPNGDKAERPKSQRKPKAKRQAAPKRQRAKGATTTFSRVPNDVAALMQARVTGVISDAVKAGYVPETTSLSMSAILTIYVVWNEAAISDVDGARLIRSFVHDKDLAEALVGLRGSQDRIGVISDRLLQIAKDIRAMRDENEATQLLEAYDLADRLAVREKGGLPVSANDVDLTDRSVTRLQTNAKRQAARNHKQEARDHNMRYQEGRL